MGLTQKPWVNFIGFQAYWWSCILLLNQALVLCVILLCFHLYFHSAKKVELQSLIFLGVAGFIVDASFTLFGIFEFTSSSNNLILKALPPAWLLLLWIGFASNVTTLSGLFKTNWLVMAVTGGALAPLSYLAAAKLEAVVLPFGYLNTWLLLTPVWFFLLPALFFSHYKIAGAKNDKH